MGFKKGKMVEIDGDPNRIAFVSTDTGRGSSKTLVREFSNLDGGSFVDNKNLKPFNTINRNHDETVAYHYDRLESMGVFELLH